MKKLANVVMIGILLIGTTTAVFAGTGDEVNIATETSDGAIKTIQPREVTSNSTLIKEKNNENAISDTADENTVTNSAIVNSETNESTTDTENNKIEAGSQTLYSDLKATNWAYKAVDAMSKKGIVKGYNDGKFRASNPVTYGEFIKMALVASTNEDVGNSKTGNWARSYYNRALWLKYFGANDISESQLNYPITRSDMALIISNILSETKIDNYSDLEANLKDINSDTKNSYDVIKVYASGIITGYNDSTFKPEKTLTRAESATVIYRLADESKRIKPNLIKEEVVENSEEKTVADKKFEIVNSSDYYDRDTNPFKESIDSMVFTDKAEYYEDATQWNIRMFKEFDGKDGAFDIDIYSYFIYLVKDGKMYYCSADRGVDENMEYLDYSRVVFKSLDLSEADHIICIPTIEQKEKYVKIIKNPLKTK